MAVKHWKEVVRLAEHYRAIDIKDVYLSDDSLKDKPWEYVTGMDEGGTIRLGIATSVWFQAKHPCGILFKWQFDLELPGSNGAGDFRLNVSGIETVKTLLSGKVLSGFQKYLKDCALKVRERGEEFQRAASRQFEFARAMESL